MEEINPEESYVLKKNPNYKYADEVKLDGVKVVFMAQGTSTLTALKNGEIDMTNNISPGTGGIQRYGPAAGL